MTGICVAPPYEPAETPVVVRLDEPIVAAAILSPVIAPAAIAAEFF